MLRFRIWATTIPVALAGFVAYGNFSSGTHPCIPVGETTLQIAGAPWQAQSRVGFTNDPTRATVRVQLVGSAEDADFAVIDDVASNEADACPVTAATRYIGIAESPGGSAPVIYLTTDPDADYRIYVKSRSFTAREAAALIVGARGAPRAPISTAAL